MAEFTAWAKSKWATTTGAIVGFVLGLNHLWSMGWLNTAIGPYTIYWYASLYAAIYFGILIYETWAK